MAKRDNFEHKHRKKTNKEKALLVVNTIIFLDFYLRMPSYDQT